MSAQMKSSPVHIGGEKGHEMALTIIRCCNKSVKTTPLSPAGTWKTVSSGALRIVSKPQEYASARNL